MGRSATIKSGFALAEFIQCYSGGVSYGDRRLLTGVTVITVIVTVATLLSAVLSLALYVKESLPLKLAIIGSPSREIEAEN